MHINLLDSEKSMVLALVSQALKKAEAAEREGIYLELSALQEKLEKEEETVYHLPLNLDEGEMVYAMEVIDRMEEVFQNYVKKIDVNDINSLEEAKKELSVQLMYLSTYKDKFLYQIEHMEDVFKKEIFAKLTEEISLKSGKSYTQAEKMVNADQRYSELRKQVVEAKIYMQKIKTKYDFFSKMIQVIVQSISVAGKEQYSARVSN